MLILDDGGLMMVVGWVDGGLMMVVGWVDGGYGLIADGGLGCDGSVRGF